jgi:two-component system, cell cycle sensor histidine kinase and response regulator CckA
MPHHRISLIVDDEPAVRNYIRTILERECFETVEAGTGKRGLELLQDLGPAVELIVSDVHMPEGDGLTFAREAAQSFPGVPIIVISGYVGGYDAWPFEFLEKPFSPDSLLRAVRKAFAAKAA